MRKAKEAVTVLSGLLVIYIALFGGVGAAEAENARRTAGETRAVHTPMLHGEARTYTLPVIMYHSILKDEKYTGMYVVTPAELEEDLLYLRQNGYRTVSMADLIDFSHDGIPLPEKPVLLTFDDGMFNNYLYVLPLLEKYDACALFSLTAAYCEQYTASGDESPYYSYLSWARIREMAASGRAEFGNHSYDMHNLEPRKGSGRMKGENEEAYKAAFTVDTQKAQRLLLENAGIVPIVYTYPFGNACAEAEEHLKEMGFLGSLSCAERLNTLMGNPEELYLLGRFVRPGGISSASFFEEILAGAESEK